MRECESCGDREGPFVGKVCIDCQRERDTAPRDRPSVLLTRASYRARLRSRARSPQLDLVDLIVPMP